MDNKRCHSCSSQVGGIHEQALTRIRFVLLHGEGDQARSRDGVLSASYGHGVGARGSAGIAVTTTATSRATSELQIY